MKPEDVRRLRESLGMTQEEMANYLGLRHRSQVHHLETGRTAITGPTLRLLQMLRDSGGDPKIFPKKSG